MSTSETKYKNAIANGTLPGIAVIAGDAAGNIIQEFTGGKQSLQPGNDRAFQLDTMCNLASCSKIMTIVAILQCVEDETLKLDESVFGLVPEVGQQGIVTGWDEEKKEIHTKPNTRDITLRTLLCHTSGYELDFANPTLQKWRASRGEMPYQGANVEEKCSIPLVYEPGTTWAYGAGLDWAGKMAERATGETLEEMMRRRIWGPLGIEDATFFPYRPGMQERIAEMSTLSPEPEKKGIAVAMPMWDPVVGAKECIGGSGIFASASSVLKFLQAVLRRDSRLLSEESWEELFRPQLSPELEESLNTYVMPGLDIRAIEAWGLSSEVRVSWSFAGMTCKTAEKNRLEPGTVCWGGIPCMQWYVDAKAGICGVALCQLLPPFVPEIMGIHADFQREAFRKISDASK